MSKGIYQAPQNYFVEVVVCSLDSFLEFNPFGVVINEERLTKIHSVLQHSNSTNFIVFPEYTYSEELKEIYQAYCNEHNTIIIGGSGLELADEGNYYAFCPVFIPTYEEPIKVYKKHITNTETVLSGGHIIKYPGTNSNHVQIVLDENTIQFSIYICYDFLVENKEERSDIIFVPQHEHSPQQFIFEGTRIASGRRSFVIGSNNANNGQRTMGFAILNTAIAEGLALRKWRQSEYLDDHGQKAFHNLSMLYDIVGEEALRMRINIGKPYSLAFTFSLDDDDPIVIPIDKWQL